MTQRNSFLPSINGDRFSSSTAKSSAANSSQKQHAVDVMWKNPSLKYPWKNHRDKQITNLAELPNKSESFLGYDISSPEENEITARNRAIYINDFVQNYVHKRETEFPRFKPQQNSRAKIIQGTREWIFSKKKPKARSILPLEFTEEVIQSRGDPCLSSYFSTDMKELYKMKDLSISAKRRRNNHDKSQRSNTKRIQPRKHTLCMPDTKGNDVKLPSKSKSYIWRKENEENVFKNQVGKSTHLWEKYVLGLISKQTAQWIANQCSAGEQRGRLIGFLDEKYEIKDLETDGTATVNKILSINDDAITLPKKEKFNS